MRSISFTVWGRPVPQGSMRAFKHKHSGAVINVPDNKKTLPWKQEVAGVARSLDAEMFGEGVPVKIHMHFFFTRPASVSVKKRPHMTVKPDCDKLIRAINDAIKGILIHDDSMIVDCHGRKFYCSDGYGQAERVEITVSDVCE